MRNFILKGRAWTQLCLRRVETLAAARLAQGVQAFDEHQHADDAEEDDVAQLDEQIDLARLAQEAEDLHPGGRPDQAPRQKDEAHADVDCLALEMGEDARDRGGDDLVASRSPPPRPAGCPTKNRSGVIRKPPPTPNMPDSTPTIPPRPSSEERVDGHLGDGQVDLHAPSLDPRPSDAQGIVLSHRDHRSFT